MSDVSYEYAIDDGNFNGYFAETINLSNGQSMKIRATDKNSSIDGFFILTGSLSASGNIQTLLDKTG
jgi:hypothetical protein